MRKRPVKDGSLLAPMHYRNGKIQDSQCLRYTQLNFIAKTENVKTPLTSQIWH